MTSTTNPPQEVIDQFVGNAHGNFAVVKELLDKYPSILHADATWTETAIEAAAQTGQVEIVNYLLQQGAVYDICTAAMLGNLDSVQEFLNKDQNLVNARGAHGIPLLYFPVIRGHLDIANLLFQYGADPNAAYPGGVTPLHGAVMFSQRGMAQWLLEHDAYPNPRYDGKTPLGMALENKQAELVELLRSFGGLD